jgi:DNA-binding XRE family transcriptional regulator
MDGPHMGAVIADHRIKAGWTSQDAFAIVCGVDKQTVAYWENQRYLADMKRRIFLCKTLKIPPVLLGLTWASLVDGESTFTHQQQPISELLHENAYALYEDILIFAHTSMDKYSPPASYRFYKHQRELEQIVKHVSEREKDPWQDLLSRFYQHATFIAQHHRQDKQALFLANKAVALAEPLHDEELVGAALYRRARVHLIQNRSSLARDDSMRALDKAKRARAPFKGSCYLLAAEVNALYAQGDEVLKTQCRQWQDNAAKLLYNGEGEDDESFLTFNLYAVHHERAKTLLRFAFFHMNDSELMEAIQTKQSSADKELLREAKNALNTARKHLEAGSTTREMYLSITEARAYLIAREYEECARIATTALQFARKAHSKQGMEEIKRIYTMVSQLAPKNPYIAHLGVELGIFP